MYKPQVIFAFLAFFVDKTQRVSHLSVWQSAGITQSLAKAR